MTTEYSTRLLTIFSSLRWSEWRIAARFTNSHPPSLKITLMSSVSAIDRLSKGSAYGTTEKVALLCLNEA